MGCYFAFGSNMSRARLEARVGSVWVLGCAVLPGYEHRFDKFGFDGTAKGNVVQIIGARVHGVLYRLTSPQLDVLEGFEGGYRRTSVDVVDHSGQRVVAQTFVALEPGCEVPPSAEYLRHYATGLAEHAIDREYVRGLVAGLRPELVEAFELAWQAASSGT